MTRAALATTVAVIGGGLVLAALVAAPRPFGDAGEYLLMTESWFRHGGPALVPSDLEALRGALPDRDMLRNYQLARSGRLYCYHFWAYSLFGLPARALLGALGGSPLRALPVTNALFLAAALAAATLWLPWPGQRRLLFAGLLLTSPVLGFLLWPHPEVASFSLVVLALVAAELRRWSLAVLATALASHQNPPLLVLLLALLLRAAVPAVRERRWARLATITAAALPAVMPAAFFQWNFGVFNLSVRPGEALESLSTHRSLDLFFDLNLGMLPYLPIVLLLFLGLAVRDLFARRPTASVSLMGLLFVMAWACTANSNWNNGTTGPSRYVVWLAPLALFPIVRPNGTPRSAWWTGALVIALAAQGAVTVARGGFFSSCDHLQHSYAARAVLDRWPRLYQPEPEVFVERTIGEEQYELADLIVYRSDGRCRKALARWRHGPELQDRCGPHPPALAPFFASRPAGLDAKRAWIYVDY